MKKVYVLLMICVCATPAFAQYHFQEDQRFNRYDVKLPLIGIDLLRKENPVIVIQDHSSQGSPDWINSHKYTTIHAGFGTGLYTELGVYSFDTVHNKWIEDPVGLYTINYDAGNNTVLKAELHKRYSDSIYNMSFASRFTFNTDHKPDSEYYEFLDENGVHSPYVTTQFLYDSSGRMVQVNTNYEGGYQLYNSYHYDIQNRVSNCLTLAVTSPFGTVDTSSFVSYEYDASGRVKTYKVDAYNLNGSPDIWTRTKQVDYEFNLFGYLVAAYVQTYNYNNNYEQVPFANYEYSYDINGKLTEHIQTVYEDGIFSGKTRLVIFYDNDNNAEAGFEYEWNGTDYNSLASYKYLFSQSITGINEELLSPVVKIYPNPCNDKIWISNIHPSAISVFDAEGKNVKQLIHTDEIETSDLQPGLYWIMIAGNKPVKFLKE